MSAEAGRLATPEWVATVLDRFEQAPFFDEGDVAGHVTATAKRGDPPTEAEKKAADAERWAFLFHPQGPGELSCWKAHFGPAFEGGDFRSPDVAWVDQAVIVYWERRMAAAKHPLPRSRYAGLVWDE
jgi:hypothetical protein